MFSTSEYSSINNEFMILQNKRQKKLAKIWGAILGLTITVIIALIIIFPKQFEIPGVAWILPTYGGILLVTALIGVIVSFVYLSEKPFFEYLYKEVYKKINSSEGFFFNYESYEPIKPTFNKEGGIFTKYATVKVKRHIKGDTEEQHQFNIYDCTMITSNGKNNQTIFNGIYFTLNKQFGTSLQLRTNGSPKLKGVKFTRQTEFENIKVYKEQDKLMSNVDHLLIRYFNKLKENSNYKRIYLSVINNEIHIAISYKIHPARTKKEITNQTLNDLANYFLSEYNMMNELSMMEIF